MTDLLESLEKFRRFRRLGQSPEFSKQFKRHSTAVVGVATDHSLKTATTIWNATKNLED